VSPACHAMPSGSLVYLLCLCHSFRQIAGQKKWWFIPPHQTAYLWPAINVNGFSAHTKTQIGKTGDPSPWWNKLERYTSTLNPGDVLINPPWFWHGIQNLGEPDKLVIGSPVRFGGEVRKPSYETNPLLTYHAFFHFFRKYGPAALKPGFKPNLQADIGGNRDVRAKQMSEAAQAAHPFDEAD
jgi:hypothetical protein